ncbi:MAG: hypothetical protein JWP01_1002 [Myxococcales bacterium]|nr:hypothetical protein [Myxococcales bacterium]
MSKFRVLKVLSVCSLLVSSAATAATTGTITLGGTVTTTLEVTVTDTAGASALNLSAGEKIAQVADLAMTTNNDQGLTLTASSGDLTKAGGQPISFQTTTVADGAAAPLAAGFLIASGTNYTVGTVAAGSVLKDVYIMYTPAASQDPGAYGGTISLTVSDN